MSNPGDAVDADPTGADLLERAATARAALLRVERIRSAGASERALGYLLTFEVGRVLVCAGSEPGSIACLHLPGAEDAPSGRTNADEMEPWWRVLGNPLTRAGRDPICGGIRIQFRSDADSPRRILLTAASGGVIARLESDNANPRSPA